MLKDKSKHPYIQYKEPKLRIKKKELKGLSSMCKRKRFKTKVK